MHQLKFEKDLHFKLEEVIIWLWDAIEQTERISKEKAEIKR